VELLSARVVIRLELCSIQATEIDLPLAIVLARLSYRITNGLKGIRSSPGIHDIVVWLLFHRRPLPRSKQMDGLIWFNPAYGGSSYRSQRMLGSPTASSKKPLIAPDLDGFGSCRSIHSMNFAASESVVDM
jgi:hypothetical protein